MNAIDEYKAARDEQIAKNQKNDVLQRARNDFFGHIVTSNYVKNFTWMGVPILQLPNDLMVLQEIIWDVRPDVILETGIAFGGMLMFYATCLNAIGGGGRVVGIDNEIRDFNRLTINRHPLRNRIDLIECNSTDPNAAEWFSKRWKNMKVLISLDSDHTYEHVLKELRIYAPMVSVGSYIVVFDTTIEFYGHFDPDVNRRPWSRGHCNNPYWAVQSFLRENSDFVVDGNVEQRALITAAPGGWLRRVKNGAYTGH